jgi:RNA polymerase sigma-70 factor (ECF subfamily)
MFLLLEAIRPEDINTLFAEVYSRFSGRVKSWCRRFVRDPQRAEDMAQEVFLRAFRYRGSFRGEARASTWLFTVTRNYCLTAIRKANGDPSTGADLLDPRLTGASGFETHYRMEREETFKNVWQLIHSNLNAIEAKVLVLHFGHGLPLALIGAQLGLTNPSGAKAYIVNARRKLSGILARTGLKAQRGRIVRDSRAIAA